MSGSCNLGNSDYVSRHVVGTLLFAKQEDPRTCDRFSAVVWGSSLAKDEHCKVMILYGLMKQSDSRLKSYIRFSDGSVAGLSLVTGAASAVTSEETSKCGHQHVMTLITVAEEDLIRSSEEWANATKASIHPPVSFSAFPNTISMFGIVGKESEAQAICAGCATSKTEKSGASHAAAGAGSVLFTVLVSLALAASFD